MSTRRSLRNRPSTEGGETANLSTTSDTQQPQANPPRITPRNSTADQALIAETEETPYETLRQLSRVIAKPPTTPRHRASSTAPQSESRTPTAQVRTPSAAALRPGSVRRINPSTPHGRAALREIELRRAAALTPGERRRSLRQQRDSPRDYLRALSRVLAPETEPIKSSSSPQIEDERTQRLAALGLDEDEVEAGPDTVRPRLSIPLDELEDDDSITIQPPLSTALDDENLTVRSVELPRRVPSEQQTSRSSFGGTRNSDRFADFPDLRFDETEEDLDTDPIQGDSEGDGSIEDLEDTNDPTLHSIVADNDSTGRLSVASRRTSNIRPGRIPIEDDNTFVFTVPQRSQFPRNRVSAVSAVSEDAGSLIDNGDDIDATVDGVSIDAQQIVVTPPTEETEQGFQAEEEDANLMEYDIPSDGPEDFIEDEEDEIMYDDDDDDVGRFYDPTLPSQTPISDRTRNLTGEVVMAGSSHMRQAMKEHAVHSTPGRRSIVSERPGRPAKKVRTVNRHGVDYPSLPTSIVKKLATNFARTSGSSKSTFSKETLATITQASDWFFEQISEDLGAYAEHAGRRTIDERDVLTLMRRQRLINGTTTMFSLAQKHLPRELLQDLRMVPANSKQRRRRSTAGEEE